MPTKVSKQITSLGEGYNTFSNSFISKVLLYNNEDCEDLYNEQAENATKKSEAKNSTDDNDSTIKKKKNGGNNNDDNDDTIKKKKNGGNDSNDNDDTIKDGGNDSDDSKNVTDTKQSKTKDRSDTGHGETSVYTTIRYCMTKAELLEALNITAGMSVSGIWGSFNAKLDYVTSLKMHSFSIVVLIHARKVAKSSSLLTPVFDPKRFSAGESAYTLYTRGGDSYISFIAKGCEYIATYLYTASDEESYKKLKTSIKADFDKKATKYSGEFSSKLTKISKMEKTECNIDDKVIGHSKQVEVKGNLQSAIQWLNTINGDEVIYFSTSRYDEVKDVPPDYSQIKDNLIEYNKQMVYYTSAEKRIDEIKLVESLYARYGCQEKYQGKKPQSDSIISKLNNDIEAIKKWINDVSGDPTKKIGLPKHSGALEEGKPEFEYDLAVSNNIIEDNSKNAGGDWFDDVEDIDILRGILPVKIETQSGAFIEQINTTYRFIDDDKPITKHNGGTGGPNNDTINIRPGQFIDKVYGNVAYETHNFNIPMPLSPVPVAALLLPKIPIPIPIQVKDMGHLGKLCIEIGQENVINSLTARSKGDAPMGDEIIVWYAKYAPKFTRFVGFKGKHDKNKFINTLATRYIIIKDAEWKKN